MKARTTTTIATYALLCCAGAVSFMLPDSLTVPTTSARPAVAASPSSITLTGIIRDFRKAHADFNTSASGGFGHYAGSLQNWLPGNHKPLFVAGGYKVESQWRDSASRPIAPHMANVSGGASDAETLGLRVHDKIDVKKDCTIDSFSAARGPYGLNGNYGYEAVVTTNSTKKDQVHIHDGYVWGDVEVGVGANPLTVVKHIENISGSVSARSEAYAMPDLVLPALIGTNQGDVSIVGPTSVTWTGDLDPDDGAEVEAMRYGVLRVVDSAIVTIQGDLRVVCDSLTIENMAQVILAEGANLTFFVTGDGLGDNDAASHASKMNAAVIIRKNVLINVSASDANTGLVTINYFGSNKIEIDDKSHVYATFIAPDAKLQVRDESHVYGAFIGRSFKLDKKSQFHVDVVAGDSSNFNPAITVREKFKLDDSSETDSFDSTVGPYDPASPGADALIQSNATKSKKVEIKNKSIVNGNIFIGVGGKPGSVIRVDGDASVTGTQGSLAGTLPVPVVGPPPMPVPKTASLKHKNQTVILSNDLHVGYLWGEKTNYIVNGDVTIRMDEWLYLTKASTITLDGESTLTMYVADGVWLEDKSLINMDTGDPKRVRIYRMSLGKKGKIDLKGQSKVQAWVQGYKTDLKLNDKSEFFGSFIGEKVEAKKQSKVHVDMAYLSTCVELDDTAGAAGAGSTGGITSTTSFDEWYNDVPGTNLSKALPLTLTDDGTGVYQYIDNAYYPIDSMMLGEEGDAHNNHFTYTVGATFDYTDCSGQFIEFEGGDGMWMYINGQLVMDLGGMGATTSQYVEVDRLGLKGGETYELRMFYANRSGVGSVFRLRTNLVLSSQYVIPAVTDAFD